MEIKNNFIIRLATELDSQRVCEIRNYETVRKNSRSQDIIDFKSHQAWFQKNYFSETNNKFFILESNKTVVGYCRFEAEVEEYVISIAIDPAYHGQGWGKILLSQALQKFKTDKAIMATIARHNEVSLNLFQKYNFEICKQDDEYYYLLFGGVNW